MLLVDDENLNVAMTYSMLATQGIHPLVCNSGAQALKVYEHKLLAKCCGSRIDLVLTDISMPGMDGYEMAAKMRSQERNWTPWLAKQKQFRRQKAEQKPIRIVAITACREHDISEEVKKEAALDETVFKPISLDEIKIVLKKYFIK